MSVRLRLFFFFFNDTATTEIYTLSLHDALPIWVQLQRVHARNAPPRSLRDARVHHALEVRAAAHACHQDQERADDPTRVAEDRKSTRLNSSHLVISYAVFCLKKKKNSNHCIIRH